MSPKGQLTAEQVGPILEIILARDGWGFQPDRKALFAASKNGRRILFFPSDRPRKALTRAFRRIVRQDHGRFQLLGVLVAPTIRESQRLGSRSYTSTFPRAFFTSMEELREMAEGRVPEVEAKAGNVRSFRADLLGNMAIGEGGISHYLLKFRAPVLDKVLPPQFIMMDTMPASRAAGSRVVRRGNLAGSVDLAPRPYLKRPFGVYRAYYSHFDRDHLKRLALPPTLSLALHPPCPDHYDMLYKVLPDGIGTKWMTHLKRGQKVRMLGPLGRPFDVRQLRAQGVGEVHVIGGGVGMAPLVLLVETLRFYSFRVKVFLGIARLETLRFRDELAATFGERPRDAYIYIDDLLSAGVKPADLFVAFDTVAPKHGVRGIPKENLFAGFVTDQYKQYLKQHPPHLDPLPRRGEEKSKANARTTFLSPLPLSPDSEAREGRRSVVAFTCGPNRMMELICDIASDARVPLKLLMEKRMGCGIGVCFSCVARVRRRDGAVEYARVCREGPLFDAKDILWKENDSKPPSANSSCAARC